MSGGRGMVVVRTAEQEMELSVERGCTGKVLFEQVVRIVGIRETWYFGLIYVDDRGRARWMEDGEKVFPRRRQKGGEAAKRYFEFKFRFFPEGPEEVILEHTLRLFFKQIKSDILTGSVYCPAEEAVLLASLAAQALKGDYGQGEAFPGYLSDPSRPSPLPEAVTAQHNLTREQWEEKISSFHRQHRGLSPRDAMLRYSKRAQDNLEMFGITYFPARNARGSSVLLGVDATGIYFFDAEDRFTPKVSFPWGEVADVDRRKEKLKVKFWERGQAPLQARCDDPETCQQVLLLCRGNLSRHKVRRTAETVEVRQMRAEEEAERRRRAEEMEAYRRTILSESGFPAPPAVAQDASSPPPPYSSLSFSSSDMGRST